MKHLKEFVKSVPDYRRTDKGNYKYKLEDILLLVILGRLGKCMTRPDIIRFGERNLKRFRSLGILLDGVPSEPTLCRIWGITNIYYKCYSKTVFSQKYT